MTEEKIETLEDVYGELKALVRPISRVLELCGYDTYGCLDVERNYEDPEEEFIYETCAKVTSLLDTAVGKLKYLALPVRAEGKLKHQKNNRYAIGDIEITSGTTLEILLPHAATDGEGTYIGDAARWVVGSMEHHISDIFNYYYFSEAPDLGNLEGYQARIRG